MILDKQRYRARNKEFALFHAVFIFKQKVAAHGKRDEYRQREEMPQGEVFEPEKVVAPEVGNIEKVFENIQRRNGEKRKRQVYKTARVYFIAIA